MEKEIKKLGLQNGRIPFDEWFNALPTKKIQAAVEARLAQAEVLEDAQNAGAGVYELPIETGDHWRVYVGKHSKGSLILLGGGKKNSAARDIRQAKKTWEHYKKLPLFDYRTDLEQRLTDPEYAAEFLTHVLAGKGRGGFLLALKTVAEALGGMGTLAKHTRLNRPSLYKILSPKGNPRLRSLREIVEPLGFRLAVVVAPATVNR